MKKKIKIESCLSCPYRISSHNGIKVLDICEKSGKEIKKVDSIPRSCPYRYRI